MTLIGSRSCKKTYSAVFAIWSPAVEGKDFDVVVLPAQPLYWNVASTIPYGSKLLKNLEYATELNLGAIVATGLIIFEIQSYYVLYTHSHNGINLATTIVSSVIALCCLIIGTAMMIIPN